MKKIFPIIHYACLSFAVFKFVKAAHGRFPVNCNAKLICELKDNVFSQLPVIPGAFFEEELIGFNFLISY